MQLCKVGGVLVFYYISVLLWWTDLCFSSYMYLLYYLSLVTVNSHRMFVLTLRKILISGLWAVGI